MPEVTEAPIAAESQAPVVSCRRGPGRVSVTRWDDPASETIPGAPSNIPLWEHCIEIGFMESSRVLGLSFPTVSRQVKKPERAGTWPEEMLPAAQFSKPLTGEPGLKIKPPRAKPGPKPKPHNPNDRRRKHATILPQTKLYDYMEDVVVWCEKKQPQIESKKRGRIPFVPWDFQKWIMRDVTKGGIHVYEKSRQVAVSTPIAVAFGHALLYQHIVHNKPFHGHVFANKEDKALMLAKKSRLAVWTSFTDEERDELIAKGKKRGAVLLEGCDPLTNVKKTYYRTATADNHILIHTTTNVDIRGDDVNAFLIDEGAFLPDLEEVWGSAVAATEPGDYGAVVSTPAEETGFFAQMCDTAEEHGWDYMPIDWRANEERLFNRAGEFDDGEEWRSYQIKNFGVSLFEVEHELKRIGSGSRILNINTVRNFASKSTCLGDKPLVGHSYAKGVDIGGTGDLDDVSFVVIDLTARPAQVVYERSLKEEPLEPRPGEEPQEVIKRSIEEFDAQWLGPVFIDCTNNRAFVALLKIRDKRPICLAMGKGDRCEWDKGSGMKLRNKSRSETQREFTIVLETGALLVFEKATPRLWEAMETAKRGNVIKSGHNEGKLLSAGKQKRLGKYPDFWDAAMLSRLGMGRVKDVRSHRGRDDEQVREGEEPRRDVKTLMMPSPGDRLRDREVQGNGSRWRQGDRY